MSDVDHVVSADEQQQRQRRKGRSKTTNGKQLWVGTDGRSVWARRQRDILAEIVSDLGGHDNSGHDTLSEAQRQLARRAAALSVACEKLEAQLAGAPSETVERFTAQAGGLSPHVILAEAGRVLHDIARVRGGDGVRQMAALPDAQLDRVVDLLKAAGDLAARAIAAGSETTADLYLYGVLADRCGRTFQRLGLRRVPRPVPELREYLANKEAVVEAEQHEQHGDAEVIAP